MQKELSNMIEHLRIQNFKSWHDTKDIRLAPITAFFGSNSSGKTSLLQTLLMLKQTAESSDRAQVLHLGDERSLTDLGTFPDVIYMHNLAMPLDCQIEWTLGKPLEISDSNHPDDAQSLTSDRLRFEVEIAWQDNGQPGRGRTVVQNFAYHFGDRRFGMKRKSDSKADYDLQTDGVGFKFVRTQSRPWPLPAPTKCYGFPDQVRAYYQNAGFLSDFELAFETLFSSLFYLGPLREHPKREYTWAGARPTDMGRRGERVVDALLAARDIGVYIRRGRGRKKLTLEERVAAWLKELGLIERFEVRPVKEGGKLFQVSVKQTSQSPEVLITDVGFGVSQILPVIALCYYVPEGSTLVLEQPEIHLHPRAQMGLADVFIDAVQTRHIQIILESHSEHLLRRLQRRVAEEVLSPDKAALYFCATEKGESRLNALELDLFGHITNWPSDFFGDDFNEIAAMSEAALARQARQEAA
jgi:predicted ATPase